MTPGQLVARHGGPPLGRMKSEQGTSSSRESVRDNSNGARMVPSGGVGGTTRATSFNSPLRTELGSSGPGPRFVANLSNRGDGEPPTWSEFLRESSPLPEGLGLGNDADAMSTLAADRKRRLTASAPDSGRRTVNSGFHNRHLSGQSRQLEWSSPTQTSAWPRRTDSISRSQPDYVDLTSSPPAAPQPLTQASSARALLVGNRQYVLPKWQPDSEASECPICKRQFSLLFRRHHCRKCGRVVCNDCSPHRITIPRQFIVHPPDPSGHNQARSIVTRAPAEAIDLTDETDTAGLNLALGGGEKVRLCNPCVPDPQPSPHLHPSLSRSSVTTQTPWETSSGNAIPSRNSNDLEIPQLANLYRAGLSEQGGELTPHGSHSMMVG